MRADRLVSLVLLLRQRGRMTADSLAVELEVSTRTVLRDIDALSTAGVPVYAERGRLGGFALLPGFRTEFPGLNHDEALSLLAAVGSNGGDHALGLGSGVVSALRKVMDALPDGHHDTARTAARRLLIEPETDLLSRRVVTEQIPAPIMDSVRKAVFDGRKLRILYAPNDRDAQWRTVDPVGLVAVRSRSYLLATRDGEDRTYRLSRVQDAEVLLEPAERPDSVHLDRMWHERSTRFRNGGTPVTVSALIDPRRREELADTALTVTDEDLDGDGRLRMDMTFQDARHAEWALWQLGTDAEVLVPQSLRDGLYGRALAIAERYRPRDQASANASTGEI
ncbi:WYL domain-containing protein [Rhodococcoides fascians A21d2]|uniref:helix-turn-helix transcriptional regulator n=1 Tax=Rhodococcoides fascians TaxID=1828 RepID=UPI000562D867|nr:WYL domain-containing protein [Rhodococcus fascians]QII00212.1 WYL domain-containing protein [Rhodococcus fascians A21d2]